MTGRAGDAGRLRSGGEEGLPAVRWDGMKAGFESWTGLLGAGRGLHDTEAGGSGVAEAKSGLGTLSGLDSQRLSRRRGAERCCATGDYVRTFGSDRKKEDKKRSLSPTLAGFLLGVCKYAWGVSS